MLTKMYKILLVTIGLCFMGIVLQIPVIPIRALWAMSYLLFLTSIVYDDNLQKSHFYMEYCVLYGLTACLFSLIWAVNI